MTYKPGFYISEELFDGSPYYIFIIRNIDNEHHEYIIKTPTYGVEYEERGSQVSDLYLKEIDFNSYRLRKKYARLAIKSIMQKGELQWW